MIWRFLALWVVFFSDAYAESDLCKLATKRETKDIRAFLITLSPGNEVWSSFGHSAIWISDARTGKDEIFNFGTFNGEQPNLLGRYLNGTLEYWVSVNSYKKDFKRYNKTEDRIFVASRLLLPPDKVEELSEQLNILRKPENRSYIYHWAENSCATKIRDIINDLSNNQLYEQHQVETQHTYRTESLRHLWKQPFVWLGWHYIANSFTDRPLTRWELMYSPVRFKETLKESTITYSDDQTHSLVPYECAYDAGLEWAPETPPDHRGSMLFIGLILGGLSTILASLSTRFSALRFVLAAQIGFTGLFAAIVGTVHAALFFSALEGLHPNLNQLLASPLHWGLVITAIQICRQKEHGLLLMTRALAGLSVLSLILSAVTTQNNIELCLLFMPIYIGFATSIWLLNRKNPIND